MTAGPPHLIELKLRDVSQLFNSMDPSPFNEKDLDQDAEEFIVSWAREYPLNEPLRLRIHLEHWPPDDPTPIVQSAVRSYFAGRAGMAELEFRRLLRTGRSSLLIGLLFLSACFTAVQLLQRFQAVWIEYLRESLTIAGWVGMWRPMEIYLYDWWPLRRQERNFARLAEMPVEVVKG